MSKLLTSFMILVLGSFAYADGVEGGGIVMALKMNTFLEESPNPFMVDKEQLLANPNWSNITIGGKSPSGLATSTDYSNLPNFNLAIIAAAKDLSEGDAVLAADMYASYNPRFATEIIKANPQLDLYQPYEKVQALAKFSTGVSYFDQIKAVDGMAAVKALSVQDGLLESHSRVKLMDMYEAVQGASDWK